MNDTELLTMLAKIVETQTQQQRVINNLVEVLTYITGAKPVLGAMQ